MRIHLQGTSVPAFMIKTIVPSCVERLIHDLRDDREPYKALASRYGVNRWFQSSFNRFVGLPKKRRKPHVHDEEIRTEIAFGKSGKEIALTFGVAQSYVSKVRKRLGFPK